MHSKIAVASSARVFQVRRAVEELNLHGVGERFDHRIVERRGH